MVFQLLVFLIVMKLQPVDVAFQSLIHGCFVTMNNCTTIVVPDDVRLESDGLLSAVVL